VDRDRDGLLDAEETVLAARFAPIVVLHRDDDHRPASVPWLLARSDPFARLRRDSQSAAQLARRVPHSSIAQQQRVRSGSQLPADWTTYVHVHARQDDGVNIQYWFFYPYNDGPLFFDHEHDWEHVTVRLSPLREPERVDLARHENDSPGVSYPWSLARREGEHPIVFSALGSHASYLSGAEAIRFDQVASCDVLENCPHPVWRTWQAGGLENIGERGRPLCHERALSFPERWGMSGIVPGTSAPYGPLFHRGYCTDAVANCSRESTPKSYVDPETAFRPGGVGTLSASATAPMISTPAPRSRHEGRSRSSNIPLRIPTIGVMSEVSEETATGTINTTRFHAQ
jgi:hypothetical protein